MKLAAALTTLAYTVTVVTAFPKCQCVCPNGLSEASKKPAIAALRPAAAAVSAIAASSSEALSSAVASSSIAAFSSTMTISSVIAVSSATVVSSAAPSASAASVGGLTWTLEKADKPNADQLDAYAKIEAAMTKAAARHARLGTAKKSIRVYYKPGVGTAEAGYDGGLSFGSNRVYMNERTALHEIGHTLGVGTTGAFDDMCRSGNWKTALPLLKSFDGNDAKINCGGSHFWPYGLNYDTEWSETNADRNVLMLNAMLKDGM